MDNDPSGSGRGIDSSDEGAPLDPVNDAGAHGPIESARRSTPGVEEGISPLFLVNTLLRYRALVASLAVGVAVLVVLASVIAPNSWTSAASFMPQTGEDGASSRLASLAGQFGVAIPASSVGSSPQFYADLVKSRKILGTLAQDTFTLVDSAEQQVLRVTLSDLRELESPDPMRRRAANIAWLRNTVVSAATDRATGLIEVSVTTKWPGISHEITNRLIELVNQFNLETRQNQAAEERRFIESRLETAKAELRAVEDELEEFLRNNREFQNAPELAFTYDRLQRAVGVRQQVYSSLLQSYEQARISEVRNTPLITVVDEAEVPVKPDPKDLGLKTVLGLFLGTVLGVFLAFGRQHLARKRQMKAEEYVEFQSLLQETLTGIRQAVRKLRMPR